MSIYPPKKSAYNKDYAIRNRQRLNKRCMISYHNKTLKLPITEIHNYEDEHGLDETLKWMKIQKLKHKFNNDSIEYKLKEFKEQLIKKRDDLIQEKIKE